jgi:hypothetical protein
VSGKFNAPPREPIELPVHTHGRDREPCEREVQRASR